MGETAIGIKLFGIRMSKQVAHVRLLIVWDSQFFERDGVASATASEMVSPAVFEA
jgi:hypothetical protein